ncbi:hypothetical protein SR39_01975 [Methylobacterium radiotolerans]|mgnify:CR=1 FL=1|jgi:uncharacterized protein YydD (DUF2326 family)|uniref:DUF2326 domain-containing protein n=1 Tax=Methylobacterium TaxID=407 RepID=UPI0005B77340|nr:MULTISPECIES: DUF2326 domain-containing protein [unclassified Methylobacterium]KIU37266.1 hypothetical protein SR39_01975 [Methylobacterium radiotolerans]KZB97429.1 hypothetical protein AU375_06425 [Methylobacterium radiotolerans]RUP22619.1 MAG: DUF2326 domain-containing protein [Methylobacterium sp.]
MLIERLFTEPATIDPIVFTPGINVILGESDATSSKNNGVGKSLCIEFLNFALLKRKGESRVAKIPRESFDPRTFICVDFELHGIHYTIKRSLEEAEHPRIIVDGRETVYAKLKDATDFLTGRLFADQEAQVGFREMLGPLIRDERSEFKSIVSCFDTKARIPDNYAPHLMLLGIDLDIYRAIKGIQKELDAIAIEEARIKESVKLVRQKNLDDARSDLNALDEEVETIRQGIDALENAPAYDIVKGEILEIEDRMSELRRSKDVLVRRSANLAPIALEPGIDGDEIRAFYDQLRAGLGASIVRELTEVIAFKSKIEQFQRHLLDEKSRVVDVEIRGLNRQLAELDRRYAKLTAVLDQKGQLRNLRQTYASFQAKSDELGQLRSFFSRYDQLLIERQTKRSEIEAERLALQASISAAAERLRSFERTILTIHQFIQGNRKASFAVRTTSRKHVVDIVLRIDDDGSHSVEREKVFIYDMALLLNEYTKSRHPGILVHDNIFDVDDDTLQKSLEFVLTRARFDDDQQYILTLNVDRIEHAREEVWYYELEQSVRASFTKSNRFLKAQYQELG